MSDRYKLPDNWEDTCDGQGCKCGAVSERDCFCKEDYWSPRRLYELMIEVNDACAEIARLNSSTAPQ